MARFNKDGIAWRQCNSEHCQCRTAHTAEYNYELDRMEWKCGNCRKLTPIRKRARPVNPKLDELFETLAGKEGL